MAKKKNPEPATEVEQHDPYAIHSIEQLLTLFCVEPVHVLASCAMASSQGAAGRVIGAITPIPLHMRHKTLAQLRAEHSPTISFRSVRA